METVATVMERNTSHLRYLLPITEPEHFDANDFKIIHPIYANLHTWKFLEFGGVYDEKVIRID